METAADESTRLKEDFQTTYPDQIEQNTDPDAAVDINEAIERAGFGCGTFLYSLGPFLLFCLEGGEIIVLSIVGIMLRCEWNLSTFWVTALQGSVFLGLMISSFLFSGAGDKFGRKPVTLIGAVGVTLAGLLCGLTHRFWQLVLLRSLVGVFMGISMGPSTALTAEISTIRVRGFLISISCLAWGIGASLTSALAYFVVDPYGWRGLMIGTALLFSQSIFFLAIMGESPRFDAKKNNRDRAERTLRSIARLNCASGSGCIKLSRRENCDEDSEPNEMGCWGAFSYIKAAGRLKDFVAILIIGSIAIFIYYAVSYSMPRFLNEGYCSDEKATLEQSCTFEKSVLFDLGVISLFEPLGVLLAVILMEVIGRKNTFHSSVALLALTLSALYFCVNKTYSSVFFTASKFFAAQVGFSPFILGSEYFPTEVRSFVLTIGITFQRIGACSGIAGAQFVFDLDPRLLLLSIQIGAVIISVCLCALRKEVTGAHIE